VLPLIEAKLAPFEPRPHWAKVFTMAPGKIQSRYKQLPAFKELLKQHDPDGKFRNAYIDRNLFSA
jgi:xylitol oxidase